MLSDPIVQEILMDITDDEKGSFSILESILKGKVSDLEIAEETDIKLSTVRKVLYKLNDAGLTSYEKTQDPETKWFVYSWKFEEENVSDIITKNMKSYQKKLKNLSSRKKQTCSSHAKLMDIDTNLKKHLNTTFHAQNVVNL